MMFLFPLIPPTDIGIGTTGSRTRLGSPPVVPITGIGTTGGNLGIVNVIIKDPGYNYPPITEGGLGGGGRIFANSCQSAIRRSDTQVWEGPFNEGDIINIKIGDLVYHFRTAPNISLKLKSRSPHQDVHQQFLVLQLLLHQVREDDLGQVDVKQLSIERIINGTPLIVRIAQ